MPWARSVNVELRGTTRQPLPLLLEPSPDSDGCHRAGAGGHDPVLWSRRCGRAASEAWRFWKETQAGEQERVLAERAHLMTAARVRRAVPGAPGRGGSAGQKPAQGWIEHLLCTKHYPPPPPEDSSDRNRPRNPPESKTQKTLGPRWPQASCQINTWPRGSGAPDPPRLFSQERPTSARPAPEGISPLSGGEVADGWTGAGGTKAGTQGRWHDKRRQGGLPGGAHRESRRVRGARPPAQAWRAWDGVEDEENIRRGRTRREDLTSLEAAWGLPSPTRPVKARMAPKPGKVWANPDEPATLSDGRQHKS
ncbi:uncharacterized protein LOC122214573 [Panthera leo]|uniref:uncharacterized protein LOC122214573 n=1 Tax=Panthera leo TaxID=9689 RepID=UPI001C6969B6|nr:uncharacterized protein LOC122214573 [Panthera leo]